KSPVPTVLRQICESYPASSCLRELLQNADDAQASEIKYVLDTRTYDDSPLIDSALRAYHGPALLVKNNQIFTDADFASLASIGDSRKRDDPASTGKYGQGFNSCFHWTDSPWILSGPWLLILDPHREWSKHSGGPTYDILQDSVEIQNHLKTFQRAGVDTSQAVNATVIRIPLRTESQAKESKIVNRQATIQEITKALYDLGQEVRKGGMLFLRYVRRITVKIDSTVLWEAYTTGATEDDTKIMQDIPIAFSDMYAGVSTGCRTEDLSKSFHVNVNYVEGSTSSDHRFLLQHRMSASSGDNALDTWSRKRKLFPWVAIAAPLDHQLSCGRLFSCLRLPIENGHPVHIHGLFSIVPDRGRLSSSGQMSRDMGTQWNHFMFKSCVVPAWTELLLARRHIAWQQDLFRLWPRLNLSHGSELWSSLDDDILDQLIARNLPIWNTPYGCVTFAHGYFVPEGDITQLYGSAFRAIHLPLVSLELPMYEKLLQRASGLSEEVRILSPKFLRIFLKANDQLQQIKTYSPLLLQYCILDFVDNTSDMEKQSQIGNEFRDISLWPTLPNSWTSLRDDPLLLPRDTDEMALFSASRTGQTLDLARLTRPVVDLMEKHIELRSNWVRYRAVSDLQMDWTQIYNFDPGNTHLEICARDEQNDELLRRIWGWLCTRCRDAGESPMLSTNVLDDLSLIPLNGSRVRNFVCSRAKIPTLILGDADWMGELLFDESTGASSVDTILDSKVLPTEAVKLMMSVATKRTDLTFATSSDLKHLLAWLVANKGFISKLPSRQKEKLIQQLSLLTFQQGQTLTSESKSLLKQDMLQLPVFNQVTATAPYKAPSTRRTTIGTSTRAIRMIEGLPPLPSIPGLAFFDPFDTHETNLVDFFGLLEQMELHDLFFEHIVPQIEDVEDSVVAEAKLRLVNFVLDKNLRPSDKFKSMFSKFKLVHSATHPTYQGVRFRLPATTVDPTSTISKLFFGDENVFPESGFLKRHHGVLMACGIICALTPEILMERVHNLANSSRDKQQLVVKVKQLFRLPLDASFCLPPTSLAQLRTLKWLPVLASSTSKEYQMVAPESCRAVDDKELVDRVLCVFEVPVTPEWKALLGWDQAIERETLMTQLNKSLVQRSSPRVDKTLAYLSSLGDCSVLRQYPCILSRHGEYVLPERVLLPGGLLSRYPLAPFLDEVEPSFAEKHSRLLQELGVRKDISYDNLLRVQSMVILSTQSGKLSNENLGVVVSLLEISTQLDGDSEISTKIMIPDTEGRLRLRTDIVCGQRNATSKAESFCFVNSKISPDLVEHLGLENSYARGMRLGIELEGTDDDEFEPGEKLTSIISDTLGRYTIDSTFGEFLANANDCGATKISWILDDCAVGTHESESLLTEDLKELQGSALFVYNDGVFSDEDFNGFKQIGHGGKTDPHQRSLTRNSINWKRKAGVKKTLKTARRLFPDQLRPFHGLHGYSLDQDYYNGTLYRLPFRSNERTLLKGTSARVGINETRALLENYHSTVQMSFLFLRNVQSIEFGIRGQALSWSATATRQGGSVDDIFQDITVASSHQSGTNSKTVWRVGTTDIETSPEGMNIPDRLANKVVECGVAARLKSEGSSAGDLPNQVFCTLPTGFPVRLPISIHASFAITGDRKTIAFEDTEKDTVNAPWNQWLLTKCVPELYLEFLQDLAPRLGERAFDFWPSMTIVTSKQSFSKVVRDAFWDRLANERYEFYHLFPLVETKVTNEMSTPLKTRTGGRKRKLFKVTSLKTAQFDTLSSDASAKLTPLFTNLCPNLVCPPRRIWQDMTAFKVHEKTTSLGSQYLCNLFKIEANCVILEAFLQQLETETARDKAMMLLLQVAIPDPSSGMHHPLELMDGCRIVPKLDKTLGTIKFRSHDMKPWSHCDLLFLPSFTEADLFAESANSLIKPSLFHEDAPKLATSLASLDAKSRSSKNPLIHLVTESSNVRKIGIPDIESFLVHVEASSAYGGTKDNMDSWIIKFWAYLDPRLQTCCDGGDLRNAASVSDLLKDLKLHDTPIYRYHEGASWHYVTPQQFDGGPYVVEPPDQKQLELCRQFMASKFLILGVLRDLIRNFATSSDFAAHRKILKAMPVWQQFRPSPSIKITHNIRANDSYLCAHEAVILPCLGDRSRYIKPQLVVEYLSTFRSLGCEIMELETIWKRVVPTLPQRLTPVQLQTYHSCIEYLAKSNYKPNFKMAPNGSGALCSPSSLFDHSDDIFLAAFGESDEDHFLHPDFRDQRTYWIDLGLRARSNSSPMKESDFLECIASIESRVTAPSSTNKDRQDAEKVTGYLHFIQPEWKFWPYNAWTTISTTRMYQASTDVSSEPAYRQAQMWSVAGKAGLCSIGDATTRACLRTTWSQCPLLKGPPDPNWYKLSSDYTDGGISSQAVFDHLQFLISIRNDVADSELPEFLKDIQATYAYFQDDKEFQDVIASTPNIRDAGIWLNLPTTDLTSISRSQLDGSLRSAKSLCFNAPLDTHTVERAKNFLIPYEGLLRAVGCVDMVRPPKPDMAPRNDNSRPIDQILTAIRDMRKQKDTVDVILQVEGSRILAHRSFLIAASDKCRSQFSGEWGKLHDPKPTILVEDLTFKTLSYMVDFAYTGEVTWPEPDHPEDMNEVADKLDDLLDLLHGASNWIMDTLHDLTERHILDESETYIRPDNVDDIKKVAELARAKHLVKFCDDYIQANQQFVQDCRDMK
ncbi:MAG: hypothetical protein Q9226_005770, partial [Calogaya cf. arnoldii]